MDEAIMSFGDDAFDNYSADFYFSDCSNKFLCLDLIGPHYFWTSENLVVGGGGMSALIFDPLSPGDSYNSVKHNPAPIRLVFKPLHD
ncbi:MAG: hypothetical protein ACU837_13430 [Gammaproteobacteria bacterium]